MNILKKIINYKKSKIITDKKNILLFSNQNKKSLFKSKIVNIVFIDLQMKTNVAVVAAMNWAQKIYNVIRSVFVDVNQDIESEVKSHKLDFIKQTKRND